ncbi:MAG: TolC family protein [Candidatus Eisenbacteria bacterium]
MKSSRVVICAASLLLSAAAGIANPSETEDALREIGEGRPLTVDRCVAVALEANPTLRSSRESFRATERGVLNAYSTFTPGVSGGYGASKTSRVILDGRTLYSDEFTNHGVQLSLRQTLFSWSGIKGIHQARNSREAGRAGYFADRQELIYQVRAASHNFLQTADLLEVSRENLGVGEEQLKLAEKMKEVGAGVTADVLKAAAQVESNRLDVITAEKNLAVARATLLAYLGLDVTLPLEVERPSEVTAPVPDFEECMRTAAENRPDLREMEYNLRATNDGVGSARGEYFPSVSGSFAYDWNNDELSGDLFRDDNRSWTARLSVNVPIFNVGTYARVRQWKANAYSAEYNLEATRQNVAFEIQESLLLIEEAQKRIEVATRNVAAAEEDLRVSQGKYKHGLVPILDLIEAQYSLAQARAAKVEAVYGHLTARVALANAMGVGE